MHVWLSAGFTLLFAFIFLVAYISWGRLFQGTPKSRLVPQFSSYFMAGLHGLSIIGIAASLLIKDDNWNFDDENTPEENLTMSLSMGYFIADTFVFLAPFTPEDTVYFFHHIGTCVFLGAALHLQRGGTACVIGLLLGEATNPFFHIYNFLGGLRDHHAFADRLFRWWAPIFTAVFISVRTVIGPVAMVWWCAKVAAMSAPMLHRGIWIFSSVAITAVSQAFSYNFAKETYELLTSAPAKKAAKRQARAATTRTRAKRA